MLADPIERGAHRFTVAVRQPVPVFTAEGISWADVVPALRPQAGRGSLLAGMVIVRFGHDLRFHLGIHFVCPSCIAA